MSEPASVKPFGRLHGDMREKPHRPRARGSQAYETTRDFRGRRYLPVPRTRWTSVWAWEVMPRSKLAKASGFGAYFIAVSRGTVYSMDGLVQALDSGRLAGAGVNVTDPEPLPSDHPLRKFKNVVITPHIAGASDRSLGRVIDLLRENIRRFGAGEPLLNTIDKSKGY